MPIAHGIAVLNLHIVRDRGAMSAFHPDLTGLA